MFVNYKDTDIIFLKNTIFCLIFNFYPILQNITSTVEQKLMVWPDGCFSNDKSDVSISLEQL